MAVHCNDRERILADGIPAEWATLEEHAAGCPACAAELRAWKGLSVAAREMRDAWESPALWRRIENSLSAEAPRAAKPSRRWNWFAGWAWSSLTWQTAAAAVLVIVLSASAGWMLIDRTHPPEPPAKDASLINDNALREVERAEAAYEQAIHKLEAQAKPQLENASTPLVANYREKLLVLDSAIDDLRAEAGKNPGNAHLRRQLLAMYREKQNTLEEILVNR